jgi:hypothetical protein
MRAPNLAMKAPTAARMPTARCHARRSFPFGPLGAPWAPGRLGAAGRCGPHCPPGTGGASCPAPRSQLPAWGGGASPRGRGQGSPGHQGEGSSAPGPPAPAPSSPGRGHPGAVTAAGRASAGRGQAGGASASGERSSSGPGRRPVSSTGGPAALEYSWGPGYRGAKAGCERELPACSRASGGLQGPLMCL